MEILITIILGLIIGVVAKFFMPGREPSGFVITVLLGIAGSMLANFIGSSFGFYNQGDLSSFISSVMGAMIILAVYRFISNKNS